jgi:outer membrane protein OmpA-like peptidoglycan-associated protein
VRRRLLLIVGSSVVLGCRATATVQPVVDASAASPSASIRPFKVFPVYTHRAARHVNYAASGYMGDSDLTLSGSYITTPTGEGPCIKVNYKASGPKGWAGLFWQNPANNWGGVSGKAGYDLRGATRLTFWARGENGGERIHEFRMGGIVGEYPDSDVATISNIRLTKEWKQYTIDLAKKDLRHIIGGFGFSLTKAENSGGMAFYLDDILFQGPQDAVVAESPQPLVGQPPVETPAAVVPPAPSKDLEVKQTDEGLKVSFSSRLLFKTGQSVLDPSSDKALNQLVSLLNAYPKNQILIEGHTDNTGDKKFNLGLSETRATAVRDYLIKQGGFETSRFQVVGFGDTKPIADNATKTGRALNRRVVATILKSVP